MFKIFEKKEIRKNRQMQVGDIVLCKENFEYQEGSVGKYTNIIPNIFIFEKGKYYLITDMYNYSKVGSDSSYVQVYVEVKKDFCNLTKQIFEKSFLTTKELRKMKLDEINGKYRL